MILRPIRQGPIEMRPLQNEAFCRSILVGLMGDGVRGQHAAQDRHHPWRPVEVPRRLETRIEPPVILHDQNQIVRAVLVRAGFGESRTIKERGHQLVSTGVDQRAHQPIAPGRPRRRRSVRGRNRIEVMAHELRQPSRGAHRRGTRGCTPMFEQIMIRLPVPETTGTTR